MKKILLFLLIGIYSSISMFSYENTNEGESLAAPPLWVESVTVTVVCNPDGGYTYTYDIKMCQIPYDSLDSFHVYTRPGSGNSWTYGGTATQVGNDNLHFTLTVDSSSALDPGTWVIHPMEYYYDPSVIQQGTGKDRCGYYVNFTIPPAPDCDKLCDLPAPNVHVYEYAEGTLLYWSPVPGATGYVVSPSITWNRSCNCRYPISIPPIETRFNYVWLPSGLSCYSVRVTAVCANGSFSPYSEDICIGGGIKGHPKVVDSASKQFKEVSVTPNPTKGEMTFNIDTNIDTEVTILVHDTYGTLIKTFVKRVNSDKTNSFSWDGSRLRKGIYFVNFTTKEETIYKQVIVK